MANKSILNTPTDDSSSSAWITWHKALRKRFGKRKANELFMTAWDKMAGEGSDASTTELRKYMKGQGVDIDTSFLEGAADFGSGVSDTFSGMFSTWKYIMIGGVILTFAGIGYIIYNVGKDPSKVVGATKPF